MGKINETEFNAIKIALNKGAKTVDVAKMFGYSTPTIGFIKRADSLENYREIVNTYSKKKEAKKKECKQLEKTEKKEPVAMTTSFSDTKSGSNQIALSSYQLNRLIEKLDQQNEYLKLISAKLAFVVEQLA